MTEVDKGKWLGRLFVFCGIFAVLSGKAGWTLYGRLDGDMARVVGGIMILFGCLMMFPKRPNKSGDRDAEKKDG
jgi:uncharacterized membrane protein YfcA